MLLAAPSPRDREEGREEEAGSTHLRKSGKKSATPGTAGSGPSPSAGSRMTSQSPSRHARRVVAESVRPSDALGAHRIRQAGMLEGVASPPPGDRPSCT